MEQFSALDELRRRVLDVGLCSSCGACVGGCPYLTVFRAKTVALDACAVEHGRCLAYCPMIPSDHAELTQYVFGGSRPTTGIGIHQAVMASRATNEATVASGQGGGTVSAIISDSLEQGLIDCAVLTGIAPGSDYPGGVIAETASDVMACSGSKYIGGHALSALRQALDRGKQAIGIVGLPCQALSVRKMMLYDMKQEDLRQRIKLTVGLFCNWAFSGREFMSFLTQRFPTKNVKRIHIPPPPANRLDLETETGSETLSLDEVRHFIQASCWKCPDMTAELADISVGMFEGQPGWNTLIIRTDGGRQFMDGLVERGVIETEVFPEANLAHLESASIKKKARAPHELGQAEEIRSHVLTQS